MDKHETEVGGITLQVFNYEDNPVSFKTIEGEIYINATEMAKRWGKKPHEWLRLPSTASFLEALSSAGKSLIAVNPIVTEKGGIDGGGGTWLQEVVAIEFARWLSPQFSIWCNQHIRELMRHGITATPQAIEDILADPDAMIAALTALKQERSLRQKAEHRAQLAGEQLMLTEQVVKEQAPKVHYYDTVMQSNSIFAIDIVANDLGVSAVKLNRFLYEQGVIYRQQGVWVLASKYRDLDYAKMKTTTFTRSDGQQGTSQHMYWTEKGKEFIRRLYRSRVPQNKKSN